MAHYVSNWNNSVIIKRVNVGEDHVNFIHQLHMCKSRFQVDQLHNLDSPEIYSDEDIIRRETSCNCNINGLPTTFIEYKKLLGHDVFDKDFRISISSSLLRPNDINSLHRSYSENELSRVDFEFQEAVYPIRVSIHEGLNPVEVMEIWARDSDQWFLLWTGKKQFLRCESGLFSPPIRTCNFKTKMLRLIFPYKGKGIPIDAVDLIGTSELIQPKDRKQSLTDLLKGINRSYPGCKDMHNLTPDYKNVNLDIYQLMEKFSDYCIIRKSNLHLNNGKLKGITPSPSEFKEQPRCNFSMLPDEMILKILEYLDLRSLCLMSQTNKRFNRSTRDPLLFQYLNIQDLHMCKKSTDDPVSDLQCKILSSLESRCKNLKQLDLVSCDISSTRFVTFLKTCGSNLRSLRLIFCLINNDVLREIVETCKNLTVLNLTGDYMRFNENFSEGLLNLQHLQYLERLTLRDLPISDIEIYCKILQGKHRLRYLALRTWQFCMVADLAEVTIIMFQEKELFSNLETIKLSDWAIDSRCIAALAESKNLRMLSVITSDKNALGRDSWCRLFSFCQRLGIVFMPDLNDDEALTLRRNLKERFWRISKIVEKVAFYGWDRDFQIHVLESYSLVNKLRGKYPHVSICSCYSNNVWCKCLHF
ncbi:PREDICTED: uncharacterized protein LOC105557139 [Vollenhovia emeryi]|uniref:uncharacterized protein LOC105557139 n=1 Tax=Vollenhovia emeryi TaxID=411798 RepID=UPI0005F4EC3C|nr:PREDICTED: uncharacterized protein LOC105557139 [Vollenhovia emeryi]